MDNQVAREKYTKKESDYTDQSSSPAEHRCGICEFHLHVPGTDKLECGIVKGTVEKMGGCKFFEKNLIAAANDKITLSSNPPTKILPSVAS
jgi:hypothetical protein